MESNLWLILVMVMLTVLIVFSGFYLLTVEEKARLGWLSSFCGWVVALIWLLLYANGVYL